MASKDKIRNIEPMADVMFEGKKRLHSISKLGSFNQKLLRADKTGIDSRLYLRGDPLKAIDWKNFARTDQLVIRQSRDESQARAVIYIDYSDSMCWPTRVDLEKIKITDGPIEKFEMAIRLALSLSYGHVRRGDRVEMVLLDHTSQETFKFVPNQFSQLIDIFCECEKHNYNKDMVLNNFDKVEKLDYIDFDVGYYISDLIQSDYSEQILKRGRISNLFLLHSLSCLEKNVDWFSAGLKLSEDYNENDQIKSLDLLKSNKYSNEIEKWLGGLQREKESLGYRYVSFTDDASVSSVKDSINL